MQAQLASERKAHKVFLADEQKGKKVVQVSWQSVVCSACLQTCMLQASVIQDLWCSVDALLSVFLLST